MIPEDKRIRTRSDLKDWLKVIGKKYGEGGVLRYLYPVSELDILRKHQILLRKTEYYTNTGKRIRAIYFKTRLLRMQNRYSLQIPINTCGKGLRIMHVGPVLINGRATIGENCSIHMNTAIIAGGVDDGVPNIGDNVVIGVGAVVIGNVDIGDHITIGANAVVTKSFSEGQATVAGVPAHILHQKS